MKYLCDRAVCLNLDLRFTEQEKVRREFGINGIDVEFFVAGNGYALSAETYDHIDITPPERTGYPAWVKRPNSYNAFLCFQKIIRKAKNDGVGTLLLLEDDAYPTENFGDVLAAAWGQLHEYDPDWHMLYLGANHGTTGPREVADNILKLNGSCCWHSIVLRSTVFDAVLSLPMTSPIDSMCAQRLHKTHGCYAIWPNICLTKPGFSHCEGRDVDYLEMFLNKGC